MLLLKVSPTSNPANKKCCVTELYKSRYKYTNDIVGDLSVENFFKEVSASAFDTTVPVVDNILVNLDSLQLCCAVMTLAGSLHIQVDFK